MPNAGVATSPQMIGHDAPVKVQTQMAETHIENKSQSIIFIAFLDRTTEIKKKLARFGVDMDNNPGFTIALYLCSEDDPKEVAIELLSEMPVRFQEVVADAVKKSGSDQELLIKNLVSLPECSELFGKLHSKKLFQMTIADLCKKADANQEFLVAEIVSLFEYKESIDLDMLLDSLRLQRYHFEGHQVAIRSVDGKNWLTVDFVGGKTRFVQSNVKPSGSKVIFPVYRRPARTVIKK